MAHYDHLGIRNGVLYPGADDNASGVGALLQLAERFRSAPLHADLFVVASDAEEEGLRGARALIDNDVLPLDRLQLVVNIDMVSRSETNTLYVAGTHHTPFLRNCLDPLPTSDTLRVRYGYDGADPSQDDWTLASDHGPFHRLGIPFLYAGVEDHRDYHKPSDTADRIRPAFYASVVNTLDYLLRRMDLRLSVEQGGASSERSLGACVK